MVKIQKKGLKKEEGIPFITSPEIEDRNKKIREMKAISNRDFVINLLETMKRYQIHNELGSRKRKVKISFDNLMVENDWGDVAKTSHELLRFKELGIITGYDFKGVSYDFFDIDVEKIKKYLKQYQEKNENIVSENNVSFIFKDGKGKLCITGCRDFVLEGERASLVNFFYNSVNRKTWKKYDEIKKVVNLDSHSVRQAIEKINKRFQFNTGIEAKLIESFIADGERGYCYRWGL